MSRLNVGDVVYRPYTPQRAGRVISIDGPDYESGYTNPPMLVTVRTLNGESVQEAEWGWRHLDNLIADHEKKLETHRKLRERVLKEIPV